jgi:hypothetical protein
MSSLCKIGIRWGIHVTVQRTAAKRDWRVLSKLNEAFLAHLVCAETA